MPQTTNLFPKRTVDSESFRELTELTRTRIFAVFRVPIGTLHGSKMDAMRTEMMNPGAKCVVDFNPAE